MSDVPTTEPTVITAGDTLRFTKSLADYLPADGWVLNYALVNASGNIEITGSDNGDGTHLVEELPAETIGWVPGKYRWQSYVADGTDRHTIARGEIEVRADFAGLADGVGLDARGSWQTILENLEAAYKAMSAGELKSANINVGGRAVTYRSLDELVKAINNARYQAQREAQEAGLQQASGSDRLIFARFNN